MAADMDKFPDGRADTPGHSAKYGSYAMLDMDLMLVIDIQLVQV